MKGLKYRFWTTSAFIPWTYTYWMNNNTFGPSFFPIMVHWKYILRLRSTSQMRIIRRRFETWSSFRNTATTSSIYEGNILLSTLSVFRGTYWYCSQMKELFTTQFLQLTIIRQASVEPFDPVVMNLIDCFIPITHPLPLHSETIGYAYEISAVVWCLVWSVSGHQEAHPWHVRM